MLKYSSHSLLTGLLPPPWLYDKKRVAIFLPLQSWFAMQRQVFSNPLHPVSGPWFPRWLLLCVGLVLALAAVIMVVRNTEREEERMLVGMKDRADVLIWAMEGSTRSFRRMGQATLLSLAEEMAKQPGIVYIAIVDASGRAFVHSDTALQGTTPRLPGFAPASLASPDEQARFAGQMGEAGMMDGRPGSATGTVQADQASVGRLSADKDERLFVVQKPFTPLRVFRPDRPGEFGRRGERHGRHSEGARFSMSHEHGRVTGSWQGRYSADITDNRDVRTYPPLLDPSLATRPDFTGMTIVVGIDASNFDRELQEYRMETSLLAGLIVLAGFAGTGLLFFLQNYRISRRLLENTQVMASHVVQNLPVGLLVADSLGAILLANPKSREMLLLPSSDPATGPTAGQATGPATLADIPCYDWPSLLAELDRGPAILERETEFALSRTVSVPVSLSALAIGTAGSEGESASSFDPKYGGSKHGGFSGYLIIFGDLGEVRRLQKEVRLNERLSALGNLAAGVAHEIRNPLSSIKGYATYLAAKLRNDAEASASCQLLIDETERLNRVVSELLGMTRPEGLRLAAIAPEEFLGTALKIIGPDAEEKNISLHVQDNRPAASTDTGPYAHSAEATAGAKPFVLADKDKMVQVLLNLLLNAVQATDAGGSVQVVLENTPATRHAAGQLAISITDTGCGMSAETLSQLFTPYYTTKASGTGLGLAMAHSVMEQHGGEIRVASRQGQGTTFTVFLPFA